MILVQTCIDANENGCCESGEAPLPGVTVRISVDGESISGVTDQAGEARVETCRGRCECRIQSVDTEPPAGYRKSDPAAGCSSSADAFIRWTASFMGQSESTPAPTSTPAFWPTGMPKPTLGPTALPLAMATDEPSCERLGGRWSGGVHWEPMCLEFPTTDAGRPCSDGSECQGWCDPNVGRPGELLANQPAGLPLLMTGVCSDEAGLPPNDALYCLQDGELTQLLMSHCEW